MPSNPPDIRSLPMNYQNYGEYLRRGVQNTATSTAPGAASVRQHVEQLLARYGGSLSHDVVTDCYRIILRPLPGVEIRHELAAVALESHKGRLLDVIQSLAKNSLQGLDPSQVPGDVIDAFREALDRGEKPTVPILNAYNSATRWAEAVSPAQWLPHLAASDRIPMETLRRLAFDLPLPVQNGVTCVFAASAVDPRVGRYLVLQLCGRKLVVTTEEKLLADDATQVKLALDIDELMPRFSEGRQWDAVWNVGRGHWPPENDLMELFSAKTS